MTRLVHLEKTEGVAIVTIDNPPMNVLSRQVTKELGEVFTAIAKDDEVIVAILTGAGNRAFMAGADIKEFPQSLGMEKDKLKKNNLKTHEVLNFIADIPKPTIAVLNGLALGGGCELALTCDIRIAEVNVKIGLPEIKLGLFPGGGGTQLLPRLIGAPKAKELMFFGEPLSAEDALKIGLVNQVVESGKGMDNALSMAKRMAGYSLQALSRIKEAVNKGFDTSLDEGLEIEAELFAEVFGTEDVREGVQAFIEKRSPSFNHR